MQVRIEMKTIMKYWNAGLTILLGIGIFLFWYVSYPFALTYQEQYQLFLFTSDYFVERVSIVGGFADYIADFFVQFYYVPWMGALCIALLSMALQLLTLQVMKRFVAEGRSLAFSLLSFIPPVLMVRLMGDESVLLTYMVSMVLVLLVVWLLAQIKWYWELLLIPLIYWLTGPMCWLYVALRMVQVVVLGARGWNRAGLCVVLPLWLLATECLAYVTVMQQWPPEAVLFYINYYRTPMQMPLLMALIPLVVAIVVLLARVHINIKVGTGIAVIALIAAVVYVPSGFDTEKYELIRQDQLIRAGQWDKIIERAKTHVVRTTFWSNSVNLALSQKRQLAEQMFNYYQSGEDALVMRPYRDLTSNLPTAEAYYRLGLINSAQRYMFDIQESIMNFKKSGRCTKRIAECMLINGHYKPAAKQLNILKHSLFYRSWAEQMEQCLYKDSMVDAIPEYKRLRQLRFKDDFLFSYGEIEKIFGLLFVNNSDNKMALDYFLAEQLLKGNMQDFMHYLSWAQQYGGYKYMPEGYQDAVRSIQTQGRQGGKYANYVQRMMNSKQQ